MRNAHGLWCGMLFCGLAVAAHPVLAAPTVYNFQVGTSNVSYAGKGVLDGSGTVFNRVDYTGVGDINAVAGAKDSEGHVVPGVSLSFQSDGRYDAGSKNEFGDATPLSTAAIDPVALLQNFATERNGATGTITVSGLSPATPITIVFFGTNGTFSAGTRGTKFTLYKDASLKSVVATAATTGAQDSHFAVPDNYVRLNGTTDAAGNVYASYTGGVGDEGDFNGLQIQVGRP